jgi:hypothetical protein
MFDALFKVVRTLFGPLTIEKYIEHPHFISCYSFQNLRLGTQWGLIGEHKLRNCLVYYGTSHYATDLQPQSLKTSTLFIIM